MRIEIVGPTHAPVGAVVAIADREKFDRWCKPGLIRAGVERWALVEGASSIGEAYNAGQRLIASPVALFIHEDAELLVPDGAAAAATMLSSGGVSLAGALGSKEATCLPWSANETVVYARGTEPQPRSSATLDIQRMPEIVQLLDGVVLLQARPLWRWASLAGWHGYDSQRSLEARDRGLAVMVHPGLAVTHHTPLGKKPRPYHLEHVEACMYLAKRWGLECKMGGMDEVQGRYS